MDTLVADEAFLACIAEILETKQWRGVHHRDIERRASKMFYGGGPARPGVLAHARGHIVANKPLSTTTGYRMLTATNDGLRRPFLDGDACDPERGGKTRPNRREVPSAFHALLDWVDQKYPAILEACRAGRPVKTGALPEVAGADATPGSVVGVPVVVCRVLPEDHEAALAKISHHVLELRQHARPAVLLIDGDGEIAREWVARFRSLLGDVSLQVVSDDGQGRPL